MAASNLLVSIPSSSAMNDPSEVSILFAMRSCKSVQVQVQVYFFAITYTKLEEVPNNGIKKLIARKPLGNHQACNE